MLTKRDFDALAASIASLDQHPYIGTHGAKRMAVDYDEMINCLCSGLRHTNPAFSQPRFVAAVNNKRKDVKI